MLRRPLHLGLALLLALICLVGTYRLAGTGALARLTEELQSSAQSRAQALTAELDKQRAVAGILADDGLIIAGLRLPTAPQIEAMSRKLERLRQETGSTVIYVLDLRGVAVAASNWDEPVSFVGEDYSFRDYFIHALRDGTAQQFALGTVSHRPGLYLSHRVMEGGQTVGVVVVKVEFDAIEAAWTRAGEVTHVVDGAGQILLTTRPEQRFQPMPPDNGSDLQISLGLPATQWQLVIRSSLAPVRQVAALATVAMGLALVVAAFTLARLGRRRRRAAAAVEAERRYRADLEREVADRTRALSAEMQERAAAEQRLRSLQGDLVQANKLAALGQITAGVAHEINQPLATIRLLAENGLALLPAGAPDVAGNLGTIIRMSDRIGHITTELRGFARKASGVTEPVVLKDPYDASILLTASRLRPSDVRLIHPQIPPDLKVMAEGVRLEQVLVNLLQNAHEAVAGVGQPEIRVTLVVGPERVVLTIADNGPGLAPEVAAHLFTPFQTTKPQGLGLGLVIAHDIARDFGGRLWADPPAPGKGASFHLELRRAQA